MNRLPLCYMLLVGFGLNGCAQASSPDAWEAHDKQVIASCLEASQLKQSRALSRPLEYPDALGVTAVLLGGQYPQAHMQGRAGRELFLYHKKPGRRLSRRRMIWWGVEGDKLRNRARLLNDCFRPRADIWCGKNKSILVPLTFSF